MKSATKFVFRSLVKPRFERFAKGGGDTRTNPYITWPTAEELKFDFEVHLDGNKTWIQNKSINSGLTSIYGFVDVNDDYHPDMSDPFAHLRGQPFWSWEQLAFIDPYYHSDDHEPLMNTPHGYVITNDPLDHRNHGYLNNIEYAVIGFVLIFFAMTYGKREIHGRNLIPTIYHSYQASTLLEEEMRKIRIENEGLEKRLEDLKSQLE